MAVLLAGFSTLDWGTPGDAVSQGERRPLFLFAVVVAALSRFLRAGGHALQTRQCLLLRACALGPGGLAVFAGMSLAAGGDALLDVAGLRWGRVSPLWAATACLLPCAAMFWTLGFTAQRGRSGICGAASTARTRIAVPHKQFISFLLGRCQRFERFHYRCESFWLRVRGR